MRISYICVDPGVPVFGSKGCSVHVQGFLEALCRAGAEVDLFTLSPEEDRKIDFNNIRIHLLPRVPKGDRAIREQTCLQMNDHLYALLKSEGPYDLIYERYSLWSFAGMQHARAAVRPGILEVNAPLIEEESRYRQLIHHAEAEMVAKEAFGAASALIAVSNEVAAYLRGRAEAQGKVHVIPNGVSANRFPEDTIPTYPQEGVFTVGFLGSLKPWHDLRTLIYAFAQLRRSDSKVRLLIVGEGPERTNLQRMLQEESLLDFVDFTRAVAPEQVPGLLASMDVAVAPYSLQYPFYFSPIKIYEYMAAGLPVVASSIGQIREIIQNDVNGILCPPDDFLALSEILQRLKSDTRLRTRLGKKARASALRHHTWDKAVQRILKLASKKTPSKVKNAEVFL